MPIRKPAILTATRLNTLQDRALEVVRDGKRDPVPIVCDPLRIQRGVDYTNLSPSVNAGWRYDVAGGYAYNGGAGGLDDDYGVIGFHVEEGDELVGWRALIYRTSSLASGMRIMISAVADGTFPPLSPLSGTDLDAVAPLGVWTLIEYTFASPKATTGKSFALDLFGSVSTPGQRLGMAAVLVQRP